MTHPEGPSREQQRKAGVFFASMDTSEAVMLLRMEEQFRPLTESELHYLNAFEVYCRCTLNHKGMIRRFSKCPIHGKRK